MFIIGLNELQGVELILKALRNTSCIASKQLADGIEKKLIFLHEDGTTEQCNLAANKKSPSLKVVK